MKPNMRKLMSEATSQAEELLAELLLEQGQFAGDNAKLDQAFQGGTLDQFFSSQQRTTDDDDDTDELEREGHPDSSPPDGG